jgi:hypothetical protein
MPIKMKKEALKALLFIISLLLTAISFYFFVRYYHFPVITVEELKPFLAWVADNTSVNTPYKYWWPLAFVYLPASTFIWWQVFCYLFKIKLPTVTWLTKRMETIPAFTPLEIGLATVLITFILFNFSYSATFQFFYNFHHLNYVAGPLNDVLNGKLILVDTKTQYGVFNIFLISLIFRSGLFFSHANIHLVTMVFSVVEYLCVFMIVRILTKSRWLAFFSILFITAIHFYSIFPDLFPSELYVWPGGNIWRFFPPIPTSLIILLWVKKQQKIYLYLSQFLVSIAFFWNVESGVSFFLAYIGFLITETYLGQGTISDKLKFLRDKLFSLLVCFLTVVALYSLYAYFSVGKWPDWRLYYFHASLFNYGFLQFPNRAPLFGLNYLPIAVYAIVIFSAIIRPYFKSGLPIKDLPFLTLLATYGYGIARYYISKQTPSSLGTVIIPAGIIMIYFFHQYSRHIFHLSSYRRPLSLWLIVGYIGCLLAFVPSMRKFFTWEKKVRLHRIECYKFMKNDPNYNYPPRNRLITLENTAVPTIPITELIAATKEIQRRVPKTERVAILGYFDHPLLMQADRVNLVDYYEMHTSMYRKQEITEVAQAYSTQPKYLFVDERLLRGMSEYVTLPGIFWEDSLIQVFSQIRDHYRFEKDIGMVYAYRRIN